jgi:ADP-ribose pyrophosphatase YjhB (NUDIX family)
MPDTLDLARRLLALSQTGMHFASSDFDRERYDEIGRLAAELLARDSGHGAADLLTAWRVEDGYATPKIDVRGAVFDDDRVLLVRERSDGLWTLPGGWADVNETPRQSVEKEIVEESGFAARATRVAAILDRRARQPTRYFHHAWKVFFLCELTGGAARASSETDAVNFWRVTDLPPLSLGRSTPAQIERMYVHHLDPTLPTEFD